MIPENPKHVPVLLSEVVTALQPKAGDRILDVTFGRGGHTRALLSAGAEVVAIDQDPEAIAYGAEVFASEIADKKLTLLHSNFASVGSALQAKFGTNIQFSGILADFGVSTDQLLSAHRGFGFSQTGALDMRMDPQLGVTARDILLAVDERQLTALFAEAGGEPEARFLAREIVKVRKLDPSVFNTTTDFAAWVASKKRRPRGHLHPATKVFQALRIAVNSELQSIEQLLQQIPTLATAGTVFCAISFHEGEDRIVKHSIRQWSNQGILHSFTTHPIVPSAREQIQNPQSRSAKMRIAIWT